MPPCGFLQKRRTVGWAEQREAQRDLITDVVGLHFVQPKLRCFFLIFRSRWEIVHMPKNEEKEIERYKAMQAYQLELVRATNVFEHAALKPPFILNGGALVVMMALLGAIWKDNGQLAEKGLLVYALACWGVGLFFAAIAAASGYQSQFAFLKARHRELDAEHANDARDRIEVRRNLSEQKAEGTRGVNWRTWAKVCVGFSLLLFLAGVVIGVIALLKSISSTTG